MRKFRRATTLNSEIISVLLLDFKPIFDLPLKKVVRKAPSFVGGALVRIDHSLARVKIWRRSTPLRPKYVLPKNALSVGTTSHLNFQGVDKTCMFCACTLAPISVI